MRYFVVFILIGLFSSCDSSKNIDNDLAELDLKGKVKSIREIPYNVIEKFGKVEKVSVDEFGDNNLIKFNNLGKGTEFIEYYEDGSLSSKYTYKYDDNGNQIEENYYNSDGVLSSKDTYKYDVNGNHNEGESYNSDGGLISKYLYKHDEDGNIIEEIDFDSNGILEYKTIFKYDDKGNPIEENNYKSDGSLVSKNTYKYDDKGNQIEENVFNSDGSLYYKSTSKYHSNGDKIEMDTESYRDEITERYTFTYEYTYDSEGNWIKQIGLVDGKPEILIERDIEYYDVSSANNTSENNGELNSNEITEDPNHGMCKIATTFEVINKFGGDYEQLSSQITYNDKGKRLEYREFSDDSHYYFIVVRTYNKKGNEITYHSKISMTGLKSKRNGTTTYDEVGNKIEQNNYNPDGGLDSKTTYKYDDKGNQIEENLYKSDGGLDSKYTYKYDDNGNQIQIKFYESDGSLYSETAYKYDNKGNQIEAIWYKSDGGLDSKNTYKYDDKGNQIEQNNYNPDGSLDSKYTYRYDDNGNSIEANYYYISQGKISKNISKYEYCSCSELDSKKIKGEFRAHQESAQSNQSNSSSSSNSSSTYSKPEAQKQKCYSCNGTGKCRKCSESQRVEFKGKHGFENRNEVRLGSVVCRTCKGDGDKAFGNRDNSGVIDEPCRISGCNSGWIQCEECSKHNPGACRKCEGEGYVD
ncbi:hypothetical protein OAN33_05975 [Flavobacteriales bacterium]|nr:hypothetical protein [Flavobacteriales bacterium]